MHGIYAYNNYCRAPLWATIMALMAKKKKNVSAATSDDRHTKPRVVFHPPADLLEALDAEAGENDRTRTAELVRAMKAYLQSRGKWPPPQQRTP